MQQIIVNDKNAKYTAASTEEQVNNPSHYQSNVKGLDIDALACMRAAFGDSKVKSFCISNALKYVFRSSSKGQDNDIKKAIWYLEKFLELGGYTHPNGYDNTTPINQF